MSKWIEFKELEPKKKTRVFQVWSKCSNCELGQIKWHPAWRHYCFFVCGSTTYYDTYIFSDRCLLEMSEFITKLNQEHKRKKPLDRGGENGSKGK